MRRGRKSNSAIAKFREALKLEKWQLRQKSKLIERCSELLRLTGFKDDANVTATIETTDYSNNPKAESLGTIYISCGDFNEALTWSGIFEKVLQRRFSQSPGSYHRYHSTTDDGLIKVTISWPEPVESTD